MRELTKDKKIINGYVVVKCPDHPRAYKDGWVYEHVLIAENMLGRDLKDDEEVHHLNFNRLDNRKKNLLVLSKSSHTKLHNFIDRINGLQHLIEFIDNDGQYHVEQCLNCHKYIKDYNNDKFCDMDCKNQYYDENKHIPISKEELATMLEKMNKVEIAKKLKTNRSNIQNWQRKYKIGGY